jgi:type III pantothenate kinase
MSVNLCVDWGNTSVKTAIFHDDKLTELITSDHTEGRTAIENALEKHRPAKSILCSVAKHSMEAEFQMKEHTKYVHLNSNTALPIMNAYTTQETLGMDRVALATAAYMLHEGKNNLVISIGTCITYNFIQKNKTFRGGAISPGRKMRLDAMHHFTDRLPEVNQEGELLLIGYDTATCMRSGTVFGMAAEIDGIIKEYESQYQDFNAILTGGDVPYFEGKLKSKIFADPNLLLKGLNLILNYNVPIPR